MISEDENSQSHIGHIVKTDETIGLKADEHRFERLRRSTSSGAGASLSQGLSSQSGLSTGGGTSCDGVGSS